MSDLFGGNYGLGIIVFTLLIRVVLLPVNYWQQKSMAKMQDLQPQIQAIEEKYPAQDQASIEMKNEEQAKLMEENDVNPLSGCLPTLVQLPVLMALYQSISRTELISQQSFLWMSLSEPDPYYILPIIAAIFTFINTKLMQMSNPMTQNSAMTYIMPIFIFLISFRLPSAISIYFATSNIFSVVQTLLLNNPFKKRREQEEQEEKERLEEDRRQKALRKAKKTGRSVKK